MSDLIRDIINKKFSDNGSMAKVLFLKILDGNVEEFPSLADAVASIFPTVAKVQRNPDMSHTPYAYYIRMLFSVVHKNGTLLDQWHPDRKAELEENKRVAKCWANSFVFCDVLDKAFEKIGNTYGRVLLHEVVAHRHGDLAVMATDKFAHIEQMEEHYLLSYKLAKQMRCVKQYFTPWYWGACYFSKLGMKEKCVEWFRKFYKECEPMSGRESYVNKVELSLRLVQECMTAEAFQTLRKSLSKSKSPAVQKALKR